MPSDVFGRCDKSECFSGKVLDALLGYPESLLSEIQQRSFGSTCRKLHRFRAQQSPLKLSNHPQILPARQKILKLKSRRRPNPLRTPG